MFVFYPGIKAFSGILMVQDFFHQPYVCMYVIIYIDIYIYICKYSFKEQGVMKDPPSGIL